MGNITSAADGATEWDIIQDGDFLNKFMDLNFTKSERVSSVCSEFKNLLKEDLEESSGSFKSRQVFAQIMLSRELMGFDAVLLKTSSRNKFQAFIFKGERKKQPDNLPLVYVSYGVTPDVKAAETYLRKCAEVEVLSCSSVVFDDIQSHVMKHCKVKDLINVSSGIQLYDGLIPPMCPKP